MREKAEEYGIEILTNDWLRYDCNSPVTRTEGAGPEEITAFLQKYFQALKQYLAALEKEDRSGQEETTKARRRGPLAVALLKGDVIESLGTMKLEGNPAESLVKKVAELMPYPHWQVTEDISKWVKAGLLKYDLKDGHLVWRWS